MKRTIFTFVLVFLLAFVGCNNLKTNEEISSNDQTKDNTTDGEIATSNLEIETDNTKFYSEEKDWQAFIESINDSDILTSSTDTTRNNIITHRIEIIGYQTTSVSYVEFDDSDWEFNVYWNQPKSDHEIRHHVFYCAKGVDVAAATFGYTEIDSSNDIYVKKINNGKIAYVCLINSKMFMRIVLSQDCDNFDDISKQLIDYAIEIKDIANPGSIE